MAHRMRSVNVTGTQGHSNFPFFNGTEWKGCETVTEPGLYGVVNMGESETTTNGRAYCHFEGARVTPKNNARLTWRGLGPYVTNGDVGKAVTLTVGGPGRVMQTNMDAAYGLFQLVGVEYGAQERAPDGANAVTPKLGKVVAGRVEDWDDNKAQDKKLAEGQFYLGRVLDGGGEAMLVLLTKPTWMTREVSTAMPA